MSDGIVGGKSEDRHLLVLEEKIRGNKLKTDQSRAGNLSQPVVVQSSFPAKQRHCCVLKHSHVFLGTSSEFFDGDAPFTVLNHCLNPAIPELFQQICLVQPLPSLPQAGERE